MSFHKINLFIVFLITLAFYGYFIRPLDANIASRLGLVKAIVEEKSLVIDSYHAGEFETIDKAYVNGHYYSDKAPGASLLGALVYLPIYGLDQPVTIHRIIYYAGDGSGNWRSFRHPGSLAVQPCAAGRKGKMDCIRDRIMHFTGYADLCVCWRVLWAFAGGRPGFFNISPMGGSQAIQRPGDTQALTPERPFDRIHGAHRIPNVDHRAHINGHI